MSTPLVQSLTVLLVSSNGRRPSTPTPSDDIDPSLDVVVAETTDQALDGIESGDVHAVVCEHGPPRLDAVEFAATVRERGHALPVLVYPLDGRLDCACAALDAGATDVIETPPESLSSPVLVNRIRQFVRSGSGAETPPAGSAPNRCKPASSASGTLLDTVVAELDEATRELRRAGRRADVAEVVVDVVDAVLDVPGIGVFLFDDGENQLRPVDVTDAMTEYYGGETVFGPGKPDSVTWRAFVTGETLLFDDVRTSGAHVNERTDARSGLFVPLGEHGVLVASTDDVGAFSEPTRQLLELVGAIAESTLDRIESRSLLHERDRRLRERNDRLADYRRITELVRSVDGVVASEMTRNDVETGVLDCLIDDDRFEFAWIGTVDTDSGELVPREWTDDGSQYLDELALSLDGCTEPACRTARERAVTATPNVAENLDDDGWQRSALSRGFHSVLSVPMTHDGVLYGVLTVYADRPDSFTDPVASVLEQVGETTAYAIDGIERQFDPLSSALTELELEVESPNDVLNLIAESVGATLDCHELATLSDGSTKLRFSASNISAEAVLATAASLVAVDSVTHDSSDDGHLFTVIVNGETIGSAITKSGGVPDGITADGSSLVVTVNVPETVDVRTFVGRLERRYPTVELRSRRERDRSAMSRVGFLDELETVLTDRQMDVLRTAYDDGFFKSPREATGQDVADHLGVSQPTVSHHLREGQGELFSLLFGDE